jgi:hypothetical protein
MAPDSSRCLARALAPNESQKQFAGPGEADGGSRLDWKFLSRRRDWEGGAGPRCGGPLGGIVYTILAAAAAAGAAAGAAAAAAARRPP